MYKRQVRDSFPVVWDDDRTVEKGRRTIRSRFTEFCVRGWVREQVARHRLDAANATVVAAAPETCDFDGAVKGRRRRSTVCADVIHYEGRDVRWFGYACAATPKLRLSELRAEITNLHTRVLTRGRRGSLRATAVISGADADASSLLHDFLERLVARLLAECGEATAFEFATSVVGDAPGGPRVRMVGKTEDEVAFTVILTLAAENGALALRSPEVWIRGRSTFTVGGLPLPANVLENLAQVYLSTVAVDASARSGAAFAVDRASSRSCSRASTRAAAVARASSSSCSRASMRAAAVARASSSSAAAAARASSSSAAAVARALSRSFCSDVARARAVFRSRCTRVDAAGAAAAARASSRSFSRASTRAAAVARASSSSVSSDVVRARASFSSR